MGNVFGPMVSGYLAMTLGLSSVFWSTAIAFFLITAMVYTQLSEKQVQKHF